MSSAVPVTLACWDYDRTSALATGAVRPEGVDLTYLSLPVEETFFRMIRHREFDAAEMSLSSYVVSLFHGSPTIAIPVFPSRAFRHNGIYVNSRSGIGKPEDLAGRTVGVPEYQLTAVVWIRGILAEHYGVPVPSVHYRTGGLDHPGRVEKLRVDLPPEVDVQPIDPGRTLSDMLVNGEIDAVYCPRTPRPFAQGRPEVRRLFGDPRTEEERYFSRTGIFPIMHTVVIRDEILRTHPWVAQNLLQAFEKAKEQAYRRLENPRTVSLAWMRDLLEEQRAVMGADPWVYGFAPNRHTLETFCEYGHQQGLTRRRLSAEELFVPGTLAEIPKYVE